MKLGEIVVHMDNYYLTKFHQNQMKNKKDSPFFCSEFQSVGRIVKIIHSALGDAMPTGDPGKAIMICKKVLWLKSKECWVAKWQFIRLRSVSSMTCKHEMRTQRFPLDEVNSNFQVPHVHYPSISDRLVPMLRCSSLLFWWVYSRARDKIPV